MVTKEAYLYDITTGDIMCSIWCYQNKKWIRTLQDNNGNNINIHKLTVERCVNNGDNFILCLDNPNPKNSKYIFFLDLNRFKAKIWKKPTTIP